MKLEKLTKSQVIAIQKRLNEGENVHIRLVSSNFNPQNAWGAFSDIELKNDTELEKVINAFSYYNCINSETGRRVHFYKILEV